MTFANRYLEAAALAIMLGWTSPGFAAEDTMANHEAASVLSYARLYEDADGVSHFGDGEMRLTLVEYSPPANPAAVLAFRNPGTSTFVLIPKGAFEDWHPAPRRQYAVIVRGVVEVTAGDGEKRHFGPGTIVLLEDTTGRGHQTRVISDEDSLTLMIGVDDDSSAGHGSNGQTEANHDRPRRAGRGGKAPSSGG